MFKWPWTKKQPDTKLEQKSTGGGSGNTPAYNSFLSFLQGGNNWDLSFIKLIEYYRCCEPFAESVDIIAEGFADITPILKDKRTGEVVEEPEFFDLLNYPNSEMSYKDFARHLSSMFSITGNPFIKLIGPETRPPVELDILSPQYATIFPDSVGFVGSIKVNSEFESSVYRGDKINGRYRYRANQDNELWRVFQFNPNRGTRRFWGVPMAQPCYNDIEQIIQLGIHNNSLLRNGARPSGILTTKDNEYPLSVEQFKRMQDQFDAYYSGAINAGRPLIAENMDWKDAIQSNRDMDYENLSGNARSSIYKRFRIPLPMTEQNRQTQNNYALSQLAVYDNAILPHADFLFEQIKNAILYRFRDDWQYIEMTYDPEQIEALKIRQMEYIKDKSAIKVHTVNELRTDFGDEPLDNGDVLLRPSNEIPVLEEEAFTEDAAPINE